MNHIEGLNYHNLQTQIERKKSWRPYMATESDTSIVLTDMDHFPYTRFFRGVPGSYKPIVQDRQAGWRPRQDACYDKKPNFHRPSPLSNFCFENPCTTTYPCHLAPPVVTIGKTAQNIASNDTDFPMYR